MEMIRKKRVTHSPSEVTELKDAGLCVGEQVLRFDVAMADVIGVDVGQTSK